MVRSVESWCRNYGYPQWIIDDKATYFEGSEFQQWADEKNVQLIPTAVQHPEGNGKAEKANDIIVTFIARRLIKKGWKPNRWPEVLQDSNSDALHHASSVSGLSAYQFMYAQNVRLPRDNVDHPVIATEEELMDIRRSCMPMIEELRSAARLNIIEAQKRSEEDKSGKDVIIYRPGELVWVFDRSDDSTFSADRKLKARWELCRINQALSRTSYTVNSATTGLPMKQTNGHISHWRIKKAHLPKAWYEFVVDKEEIDQSSPFDDDFARPDLQPAETVESGSIDVLRVNTIGMKGGSYCLEEGDHGEYWIRVSEEPISNVTMKCNVVQRVPQGEDIGDQSVDLRCLHEDQTWGISGSNGLEH